MDASGAPWRLGDGVMAKRGQYGGDSHAAHLTRWRQVVDARARWTQEAWIDTRVEAGKAWTATELGVFGEQLREPLNFNLIRSSVELVCGMEQQSRSQVRAVPRERGDISTARAYNELSASIDSQNRTPAQMSRAFRGAVVPGAGWLEVARNPDPTVDPVLIRAQNPFDMFRDPASREADLSDALDVWRLRWMRKADVEALFGEVGAAPGGYGWDPLSHSSDWTETHGDRPPVSLFNGGIRGASMWGPGHGVTPDILESYALQPVQGRLLQVDRYDGLCLVIERWYRCPEWITFAVLPNGHSLEYTQENAAAISHAMMAGPVRWERVWKDRVRCALFTEDAMYQDVASPYKHGRFPFVYLPAYEDDEGLPMGYVRTLRDPQREFNARITSSLRKALQRQVLFEEGAFPDEDQAAVEIAKLNGWVRTSQGALSGNRVQIRDDGAMTPVEFQIMNLSRQMIQEWSGVNAELLGQESNASSGKAIAARQSQGQTALFTLFENRNEAQIRVEELKLALTQQYYTEEREVRITGVRGRGHDFVKVNAQLPDGTIENPIGSARLDLELVNQQATSTERQAKAESMSQFLGGLPPEVKIHFAGELAEAMDMPEEFTQKLASVVDALMGAQQQAMAPPGQPMPPEMAQDEQMPPQAGMEG